LLLTGVDFLSNSNGFAGDICNATASGEQFGGNAVTSRTWDTKRGWLKSINTSSTVSGASTVLQDATYGYTAGGLMKSRSDNNAPGGALFETFQYDSLNRLHWWCIKDVAASSNECAQAQFGVGYTFAD